MQNNDLIDKSKEIMQQFDIEQLRKERYFINIVDYRREYKLGTFPHQRMFPITKDIRERIFAKKKKTKVTLYVHIPFCVNKCQFCYLMSMSGCNQSIVSEYIDALKKEADFLIKEIDNEVLDIAYIYIGGGTPTYLHEKQLEDLFTFLRSKFKVKDTVEIGCEVSPLTIAGEAGKEKSRVLFNNGISHINLGVQSFSDKVLQFAGRRQTQSMVLSAFDSLRKAGFNDININLLIGLPGQTLKDWADTVEMTLSLRPDKISFYSFVLRLPKMYKLYLSRPDIFPSMVDRMLMRIMIVEGLRAKGYLWHEIEALAVPHRRKEFFSTSSGAMDIIGLGVSAHSFMNNYQYTNYYNFRKYMHSITRGILPLWLGVEFSGYQIMLRRLIYMLGQLHLKVDKQEIVTTFGIDIDKFLGTELEEFREKKMITEDRETIKLSDKGAFFAHAIFQRLCHRMYHMKGAQGLFSALKRFPATVSLINRENIKIFWYQKLCRIVK